jgi:formate hydrogenlyase subunit 3/multisubunit Na+/H+ antiporter MnhD subunit
MEMISNVPWAVMLILLPLTGGMGAFLWPRRSVPIGLTAVFGAAAAAAGLAYVIAQRGAYHHPVGGWGAPLGIDLYADALSLAMLIMTALVALGISVYSTRYFDEENAGRFWPLWLLTLAGLNALFLSADVFNFYVTLELIGLGAVALTALAGRADALVGATRYLLAALLGSMTYLLGVAFLYHGFGGVDLFLLAKHTEPSPFAWAALGLIGTGLMLKTALFPLHFWLPSAHSSAAAPVSALLSALVIKAAFYILFRIGLAVFGGFELETVLVLISVLGAAAVLWGSVAALLQRRLKLMIAYSTIAQVGYLFLALGFALGHHAAAFQATVYLALSHAFAKSAMFLVAGNLIRFDGHDSIKELKQIVLHLPVSATAFALAGVSIIGLPPSGGFVGKWLLLEAALAQGQWAVAVVVIAGSLLAAAYVFKVLGFTFTRTPIAQAPRRLPPAMEWSALFLAFAALLMGLIPSALPAFIETAAPFYGPGALP